MNDERLENELNKIRKIANDNGYTDTLVNDLIVAHRRKKELRTHTTLELINESVELAKWASFNFNSVLTDKIKPIIHQQNIKMSECSKSKLINIIGGSKDKVEEHEQSGIYSIKCNCCEMVYVGQTRRALIKRFKEHRCHTRKNEPDFSSVAKHMLDNDHNFDLSSLKLIQRVDNFYELNATESFYINKFKNSNNLMNENDGPIKNSIFAKYYA